MRSSFEKPVPLDTCRFLSMFFRFSWFSLFRNFFERQESYGAENLITERSRPTRFFVLCMGAPPWPKNFEKTSRKSCFPIFVGHRRYCRLGTRRWNVVQTFVTQVPSVATKSGKNFCAKFFQSFLAMRAPPCTKQKIGDIEISLLSNFQLGATLGAQKNEKKRKLRKPSKYP